MDAQLNLFELGIHLFPLFTSPTLLLQQTSFKYKKHMQIKYVQSTLTENPSPNMS